MLNREETGRNAKKIIYLLGGAHSTESASAHKQHVQYNLISPSHREQVRLHEVQVITRYWLDEFGSRPSCNQSFSAQTRQRLSSSSLSLR
ncbi:hypothetical protein EON65_39665 [archaeon]|nr:MAG: hypothetical protein EON65_39665 [archaeon]